MSMDCYDCKLFDGHTHCKIYGFKDPDFRRYGCVNHTYHDIDYKPKKYYIAPLVEILSGNRRHLIFQFVYWNSQLKLDL